MKKFIFITIALMLFAVSAFAQNIAPPYYGNTTANVTSLKAIAGEDTTRIKDILDSLTSVYTATITTLPATIQSSREDDSTQLAAIQTQVDLVGDSLLPIYNKANDAATSAATASASAYLLSAPESATNNFLNVDVNFVNADSVWSVAGTHEVINVTGLIEFDLIVTITADLAGNDSLGVQLGSTVLFKTKYTDLDASDMIPFGTMVAYRVSDPTSYGDGTTIVYHGFSNSADIGYLVGTNSIVNTGTAKWKISWRNFGTATVVAGAGGSL